MAKKCVYCKSELDANCVVDVCNRCGLQVWGEKMFNAIKQNMAKAQEKGDLHQGSISTENFKVDKRLR